MAIDLAKLLLMSRDLKLLYVEDDEAARENTTFLLKNFFNDITLAVDGEDGLKKFQEGSFDLIITDIGMPRFNGLEMLEVIRKTDENIAIILLSAYSESDYFLQAIELEIDAFILKPIVHKQFIKTLKKVVEKINFFEKSENYHKNLEYEVQKRNAEIEHKLNFDTLTGLYSRHSFFKHIEELEAPIVMLIDIDKFKIINEVYGSNVGSKVLKLFATHLSLAVRDETCNLYRLSADEFAIVDTVKYIDPEKYEEIIRVLFQKLNNLALKIEKHIITVDISIGISTVEKNVYESAKIALDFAKKNQKAFMMYSTEIDHRSESSKTLKCRDIIASAIDNDRVIAVFQAIVGRDAKVIKHETLMRLKEENTLKLMTPFYFLDVAFKTRLYEHLSSIVIFKALHILSITEKILSINFTYMDIKNSELLEKIETYLTTYHGMGKRIVFEIVENEDMKNYDDVKDFIKRFRQYGVKIAIDDFGSGFSNFEHILEIEPDYIKIDGTLVKDIDSDKRAYTLVEAIVEFSHKLGITVIAEYVHSETIFNMLKVLGVDEYQGFYFSEPKEMLADNKEKNVS